MSPNRGLPRPLMARSILAITCLAQRCRLSIGERHSSRARAPSGRSIYRTSNVRAKDAASESEVGGRRGATPRWIEERAFDHLAGNGHTRPLQLALVVDVGPQFVTLAAPRHMQGSQRDIGLRGGRPLG